MAGVRGPLRGTRALIDGAYDAIGRIIRRFGNLGGCVGYLKRLMFWCLFAVTCAPAYANYPGSIARQSYCYSNSQSSYSCVGTTFDGSDSAAQYGCQQVMSSNFYDNVKVLSLNSRPLGGGPVGITTWNAVAWDLECFGKDKYSAQTYTVSRPAGVQAIPECPFGGAPIANYAPITCTGTPATPPVACDLTVNAVITAFHTAPAVPSGCYAGCNYQPSNTKIEAYNGINYEVGNWVGAGSVCAVGSTVLVAGSPQTASSSTGLTPADLTALATEATLQNVLAAIRAGGGTQAQNNALLTKIEANTKTAGGSSLDTADPDAFEQKYKDAILANPEAEGGALVGRPTETFNVGNTFSNVNGFMNASCPQGPSFSLKGTTYTFNLGPLCTLATGISFMVVALAALGGVKIFVGGAYA